jgi:hypothetical protein
LKDFPEMDDFRAGTVIARRHLTQMSKLNPVEAMTETNGRVRCKVVLGDLGKIMIYIKTKHVVTN